MKRRTWYHQSNRSPNVSPNTSYALAASFPLPLPLSRLPFLLTCGLGLLSFVASYPSSISLRLDALLSMLVLAPGRFPLPVLPGKCGLLGGCRALAAVPCVIVFPRGAEVDRVDPAVLELHLLSLLSSGRRRSSSGPGVELRLEVREWLPSLPCVRTLGLRLRWELLALRL
jgi:hypothetical protein